MGQRVSAVVAFLRAGYPKGAPPFGYVPLLALLPRRVTDDEITTIARKLFAAKRRPVDNVDIGVEVTRVTDEVPSADDIKRIQRHLGARK